MSEKLGKLEISELLELSKKTPKSALVLAHGEGLLEGIERVKHKLALAQLDNVRLREALVEATYSTSTETFEQMYKNVMHTPPNRVDLDAYVEAQMGEPVAYIHRNEYDEYRLEPLDSFKIKSIPQNVDIPLYAKKG